jgi:hypothetical protein
MSIFRSFCVAALLAAALAAPAESAPRGGGGARAAPVSAPAPAVRAEPRRPPPAATEVRRQPQQATRSYQTYTKTNPRTNEVYSGRTSGTGTAAQNLQRRDAGHPWTQKGYGPATLDRSSPNKDAIRGREQQLIERNRATGRAAPQINGVAPSNPKRQQYLAAAKKEFKQ